MKRKAFIDSCHCEDAEVNTQASRKPGHESCNQGLFWIPRLKPRYDRLKTLSLRERAENQCELESIRFSGEGIAEGASKTKVKPSPAFVTHFVRTTAPTPKGRGEKLQNLKNHNSV